MIGQRKSSQPGARDGPADLLGMLGADFLAESWGRSPLMYQGVLWRAGAPPQKPRLKIRAAIHCFEDVWEK